jgi:hypothetical protein
MLVSRRPILFSGRSPVRPTFTAEQHTARLEVDWCL